MPVNLIVMISGHNVSVNTNTIRYNTLAWFQTSRKEYLKRVRNRLIFLHRQSNHFERVANGLEERVKHSAWRGFASENSVIWLVDYSRTEWMVSVGLEDGAKHTFTWIPTLWKSHQQTGENTMHFWMLLFGVSIGVTFTLVLVGRLKHESSSFRNVWES